MPGLREQDVDPDPLRQFRRWLGEAAAPGEPLPIVLATATPDGRPSARVVLLKGADERGLTIFTSYASRKGRELAENPHAALVVHWPELGRQVRVEGSVARIEVEESDAYFASRPAGSRLSAAASPQSEVVPSREVLEALVDELRARHGAEPPRPETWGGLRLLPELWEFWQHGPDRLHDRLRYRRDGETWQLDRLAP